MTIVSIKSGTGAELRRIEFSDGSFFSFKTCYLPPVFTSDSLYTPGLAEGREINAEEEAAFRFASGCLRAEKAALMLVARAEQSLSGLSRKLERRGHQPPCVRAVVSRLADLGLVDDQRFARLWLETRLRLARSPRRLLAGLRARGIDRDNAEAALKVAVDQGTEQILLRRFAAKLLRSRTFCHSLEGRGGSQARALKFALKSEGFSSAAVEYFLDEEENA